MIVRAGESNRANASRGVSPRRSANAGSSSPRPLPSRAAIDPAAIRVPSPADIPEHIRRRRFTHWHITFGTYGTQLHGDERPTVDRDHNIPGTPFIDPDPARNYEETRALNDDMVYLSMHTRRFIEGVIPQLCERGDWFFRTCAAGPDHVHVLLAAAPERHGKQVRHWLKRWLSQALNGHPLSHRPAAAPWWAEGGSTKPVKTPDYFDRAYRYIVGQRASPVPE